jgi:hypothetical protein
MNSLISSCRLCGNPNLDSLLDLGVQAFTGIFPKTVDSAVPSGPLELVKCREKDKAACGLVQLRHSFDSDAMYGLNYGYRSGLNSSMVRHLHRKAESIKGRISLRPGDLVLDIGSNDGTLLKAMDAPELRLVGMDPTGVKFHQYYPPHIHLVSDFFSADRFTAETVGQKARVVTSIAMFYDLEDPLEFARQVSRVLADDGIWVFEQSYLPTMLARTSYDTICHEHVEYYALKQILWILERAGLLAVDVELNNTNGGSFSVTAAKRCAGYARNEKRIGELVLEEESMGLGGCQVYAAFRDRALLHRDQLRKILCDARRRGEMIAGYGASTKGNVVLQFCGITSSELPFIAEVNPDKFGSFTPGSLIPIISAEEAYGLAPEGYLVLPWHFRDHIVEQEKQFLNRGGKLIFPLPEIEVIGREESANSRMQWAGQNVPAAASRIAGIPHSWN